MLFSVVVAGSFSFFAGSYRGLARRRARAVLSPRRRRRRHPPPPPPPSPPPPLPHLSRPSCSTLAYLAFNSGNIASRFVVAAADRALAPPSTRALDALSAARAAATGLVFAGAFGHVAWVDAGAPLAALFFAYALVGGMLATWAFELTKEACGENQDFAVEASRANTFAQNLGFSYGGAISCALAVGFGAFR